MKITIDTKEDSHEDIRKIVALLSTLIEGKQENRNIFESSGSNLGNTSEETSEQPQTNAFANMFGNSEEKKDDYVELSDKEKEADEPEESAEIMTY